MSIVDKLKDRVPRITEYFGSWAIRPDIGIHLAERVNRTDIEQHVASMADWLPAEQASVGFVENGVGYLDVKGVLMREQTSLGASTSTVKLRKQLREYAKDDSITSVVMLIDSPGGSASGIQEMADEITRTKALKPVYAVVDGQCCSGAYWIASAATEIVATSSSVVGSIGVYTVIEDTSAAAEMAGVKVHVVKAGEYKAIGTPGTVVTQDQLDTLKRNMVDPTYEQFTAAVASGRSLSSKQVAALATGEFWHADAAVKLGLVDAISDADEFVQQINGVTAMANESNEPKAATLGELKASLPGASAEFIVAQLEKGATITEAAVAFAADAHARLQAEREAKQEAVARAANDAVDGLSASRSKSKEEPAEVTGYKADLETFDRLFKAELSKSRSKSTAYSKVANANPDLMARLQEAGEQIQADRSRSRQFAPLND